MRAPAWTPDEDAIIAEEIVRLRKGWLVRACERLPKRTRNAILARSQYANIAHKVRQDSMRANIRQQAAGPVRAQTGANIPEYLRDLPIWDKPR